MPIVTFNWSHALRDSRMDTSFSVFVVVGRPISLKSRFAAGREMARVSAAFSVNLRLALPRDPLPRFAGPTVDPAGVLVDDEDDDAASATGEDT